MKRLALLFLGCCVYVSSACAQKSFEIGPFLGCSYYIGDLNPAGFFDKFTRFAAGAVLRYNINNRFAARFNLLFGTVTGSDAESSSAFQRERNLNFESPIDELSAQMEFNFVEYQMGSTLHPFSPYIFAGFGAFRMNPEGELGNTWVALQPLRTEGQGTAANPTPPYDLIQPCIPFGIGFKTNFSQGVCLSIEWGMRKTFTGYIDDVYGTYVNQNVLLNNPKINGYLAASMADPGLNPDKAADAGSERGNGKDDWYSFAGLILTIKLHSPAKQCPSYF